MPNLNSRLAKLEAAMPEPQDWREYARQNGLSERDVCIEARRILTETNHHFSPAEVAYAERIIAEVLGETA